MANNKQRYINTRFWNDGYISELDPIEKLMFIYLLTNEHTNISGIYELPLKIMAVETGIEVSMLKKILPRLKDRVRYIEGIVVIKNFIKHQETTSVNVKKGILNCLQEFDKKFLETIVKQGHYILPRYYLDTLCIPYIEGRNYLDSNLDLDSNSISEKEEAEMKQREKQESLGEYISSATPIRAYNKKTKTYNQLGADLLKAFEVVDPKNKTYYGNKTQRASCDFLIAEYGFEEVLKIIELLPKINQQNLYVAQITTPYELQQNWVKVGNALTKLKTTTQTLKSNVAFS